MCRLLSQKRVMTQLNFAIDLKNLTWPVFYKALPLCKLWMKLMHRFKSTWAETKSVTLPTDTMKAETWSLCACYAKQATQKMFIVSLFIIKPACILITHIQLLYKYRLFRWCTCQKICITCDVKILNTLSVSASQLSCCIWVALFFTER